MFICWVGDQVECHDFHLRSYCHQYSGMTRCLCLAHHLAQGGGCFTRLSYYWGVGVAGWVGDQVECFHFIGLCGYPRHPFNCLQYALQHLLCQNISMIEQVQKIQPSGNYTQVPLLLVTLDQHQKPDQTNGYPFIYAHDPICLPCLYVFSGFGQLFDLSI